MTTGPYRLAAGGGAIDRASPLRFTFDGKAHQGFAGDTLASALLASGRRVLGRSYKYHRPRGVIGMGAEEPNALVEVGTGARAEPNLRATQVGLIDGLVAASQNRWPSLDFDVGGINARLARFLPAGFYYKTFMWPRKAWHALYEPVIRHAAGLGRAPTEADPDVYEQMHYFCDVLVAGGGLAGLAAARAAADAGARVVLIDENPRLGGRSDVDGEEIDGAPAADWAAATARALADAPNALILTETVAAALDDYNHVRAVQRLIPAGASADAAASPGPRLRLWRIRAREVVLATGAIERPMVYAMNDLPGTMLASAARGYVRRWGVAPGRRVAIYGAHDDAWRTAVAMRDAGVEVAALIDARPDADSAAIRAARERGVTARVGCGVAKAEGRKGVTGVTVGRLRESGRIGDPLEHFDVDAVLMAGGWSPAIHLFCHIGGKARWDAARVCFVPGEGPAHLRVVGAANGTWAVRALLAEALAAGAAAARDAGHGAGAPPPTPAAGAAGAAGAAEDAPMRALWFTPSLGKYAGGAKHFIDHQHDVTAADIELAAREGYQSVEHAKRYTTLGMAPDQGKLSNVNGHAFLADALGKAIPQVGTTTFRPPYTPMAFGAIAGLHVADRFQPVRETPMHHWHAENGADWEPIGQWRRPYCYRRGDETRTEAVNREIANTRARVGVLDASTLGKIEVSGPDAGAFLDRLYTNVVSTLKPGKSRYTLMVNESGYVIEDGVTVRLEDGRFLCHTTSGGADKVHAWMEEWLQTEWPELKVHVANVTEQWAQIVVAGPRARDLLQALDGDIDLSNDALPFLAATRGTLAGAPVRLFRISFSGELSYEIATPASYGLHLWETLMAAGAPFGAAPYGTEALHVMRAEKGYIAIGDETDGTVDPFDLNLDWAVSKTKDDFIGKRGLATQEHRRADRWRLVGLLSEDPAEVIPDGAHIVDDLKERAPMRAAGRVTSTYWSPTLNRSIALALIARGPERRGDTVTLPIGAKQVRAVIADPVFFDPDGARQRA